MGLPATRRRILRLVVGGAALAGFGAGRADAAPGDGAPTRGRLLVASPGMRDPRFAKTVIYMLRHDQAGAIGLVIDRLAGSRPLAEVLGWLGLKTNDAPGVVQVHWGGPVGIDQGMVLHSGDYRRPATQQVTDAVAFTAEPEALRDIAAGIGPRRHLFAFGYAGWAPRQLEAELAQDAWVTVPADEELLFDEELSSKWRRAMARHGVEL